MKNINNKYISHTSLITLMLLMMASCSPKDAEVEKEDHEEESLVELSQAQYDQADIQVGTAEKVTIGSELKVNGIIDVPPQSNVSIGAPYGGFVKFTEMLPGTKVKKGQLLAVIENPDFIQFQQDYLESLASQEYLKAEYVRQEELYKENVASGKAYQQAKSQFMINEVKIKSMEQRLLLIGFSPSKVSQGEISSTVSIHSPVSGAVRDVYINLGKYLGREDVLMDITNSNDLHVELTVYESDIPRIKAGQRIRFNLTNSERVVREAEVFLVGSGIREDRSMTVHGHLKQVYDDLLPGMYVAARIEIGSTEVWGVPEESVVRFDGKHYIFTHSDSKMENSEKMHQFEMLEVTKGLTEDGYTQVALSDGAIDISTIKLITNGAYTLLAKAKNSEEEGHGH